MRTNRIISTVVLLGCGLIASCHQPTQINEIIRRDYGGFTVWVDCDRHGAVKFEYTLTRDQGNHKRSSRFYLDPKTPERCRQTSTDSYQKYTDSRYDRGHLVPANHMDSSEHAIRQSNYMTNILPQASNMNRGAWLRTEEIAECYRDIEPVTVIGGVLWGDHDHRGEFVASHGVATPEAFWKVLIRKDRAIAWVIPNSDEAVRRRLDQYLVSIDELERQSGESIPVADWIKRELPQQSWLIPKGCNKA